MTVTVKFLCAMRNEVNEQFLKVVEVEAESLEDKKAYNTMNNMRRSRTSVDKWEASHRMTPEIEALYNRYAEDSRYDRYNLYSWTHDYRGTGLSTCEQMHRELYEFLHCKRDVNYVDLEKFSGVANVYGHFYMNADGGYPICYYYEEFEGQGYEDMCGACVNKLMPEEKAHIKAYDILEGNTEDHGEVFCCNCNKLITTTELEVWSSLPGQVREVLYTGNQFHLAYAALNAEKVKHPDATVTIFQDGRVIYPDPDEVQLIEM
jgi:hypothetical protein